MQPFVSKVVNGKSIGLTNIKENKTMKTWQEQFDEKFINSITFGGFPLVELKQFITKTIKEDREEFLKEIVGEEEEFKENDEWIEVVEKAVINKHRQQIIDKGNKIINK